jgi:hypothetical protein
MRPTLYTSCVSGTSFKNLGPGERSGASAESRHLKKRRKEVRRSADALLRHNQIWRSHAAAAPGEPEGEAHELGVKHRRAS